MTLIENGLVIDGTGRKAFPATVVLDGDKITDIIPAEIYQRTGDADIIDATGCVVSPGFIDAHSHSDTYLLIEPDAPSKLAQGVTTEINGQCGGSAVPRYGAARLSSDWASMTYPRLDGDGKLQESATEIGPTWHSMAQYRQLLEAVHPSINTVQFVGHNTLRSSVIGYEPEKATEETLEAMIRLLEESLDDGGWGLTTGLIYQPGKYSDFAEVCALAKVAARRGGMYATHMRSEGDDIEGAIEEVFELVRATGIRAEISHLKTSGCANWGKIDAVLDLLDEAVSKGLIVGSDRYPYCAAGTDLDVVLPDWAGEGGIKKEMERLADSMLRRRIEKELDASGRDWSKVVIGGTWSDENREFCGKSVLDIACGASPGEVVCRILERDACRTGGFFFSMSEANLRKIYSRDWVVPGSDASLRAPWGVLGKDHPHPRAYGTMPRFFRLLTGRTPFGDGGRMNVSDEEVVARMTSVPARRFGIEGRGVIEKGAFADIAIWNRDEFNVAATYTNPHQFATGMKAVIVNGILSYKDGTFTGGRAGRFLERKP